MYVWGTETYPQFCQVLCATEYQATPWIPPHPHPTETVPELIHSFLQVGTFFVISQDSDRVADLSGLEQWFFQELGCGKNNKKKKCNIHI